MTAHETIDQRQAEAFVGKVLGDTTGTTNTVLAHIGDRLGLFKDLAANGPATSAELARRTGIHERYAREWLSGMAAATYLTYDPHSGQFTLPPAHALTLADDGGPMFFGGVHQELLGTVRTLDIVADAFRTGGGVRIEAFDKDTWEGIERFTNGWFNNLLLQHWLPLLPDVQGKLERGASVADIGCGHGRALIKLAQTFPNSRYVGYDVGAFQIARAQANAEAAGVTDRVRFEQRDAAKGLSERYDLITTFDVVHDTVDPRGLLRAIRQALKPDGIYVCLEINCSDKLEENIHPVGALFYGFSVLLCLTQSLAEHGEGLGTMGLPESKLRGLSTEAGFGSVRRVPMDNPFNSLYEIRASIGGI
jgi:SAM-dependent methyltransferase